MRNQWAWYRAAAAYDVVALLGCELAEERVQCAGGYPRDGGALIRRANRLGHGLASDRPCCGCHHTVSVSCVEEHKCVSQVDRVILDEMGLESEQYLLAFGMAISEHANVTVRDA
jgi:hypothetical protein